jgi:hypothetical protein
MVSMLAVIISVVGVMSTLLMCYLSTFHVDWVILLLPKHADGHYLRWRYPREGKFNNGLTKAPQIYKLSPTPFSDHIVQDCMAMTGGGLVHVQNFLNLSSTHRSAGTNQANQFQKEILQKLAKVNAGKAIRLVNFQGREDPHFSPSCSKLNGEMPAMDFEEYVEHHMLNSNSNNAAHRNMSGSYFYAGFESITDPKDVEDLTGYNWRKVTGEDYKQNNLFISNFPQNIFTAPLHAEPVDSFSIQLFGTKIWYFIPPEEIAKLESVPMPTVFNLPMTDDELLSKISKIIVVKQEPGDLIYFGPHWGHVVETSSGPNLMFSIRLDVRKRKKLMNGPKSLLSKLIVRYHTRSFAGRPQDNRKHFPMIYDDLNSYYPDCGRSVSFESIVHHVNDILH